MTRTARIVLDVTYDDTEDHPAGWQWQHSYDPRPEHLPITVVPMGWGGADEELLTVLGELRDRIKGVGFFGLTGVGLAAAARMVQDTIDAHTDWSDPDDDGCEFDGRTGFCRRDHECPEPPDLDGEGLFPARPVSPRDAITDGCLEATRD